MKKTLISLWLAQRQQRNPALLKQHQIVISEQEKTVTKQIRAGSAAGCRQEKQPTNWAQQEELVSLRERDQVVCVF